VDRDRFDQLVRKDLPQAHRLAIRLCGDPHRAEDVVQEAMLRATRSWRSFRGESSFSTWLFRLTINAWRDEMRRRPAPRSLEAALSDPAAPKPADRAVLGELESIVAAHVSALPPRQREVLVLIVYHAHSTAEAANVLRISEASVRTNLHLAREKLKQNLARYLGAGDPSAKAGPHKNP
jgi:RNA polymerase sigma-70 factor (ECF subfamily)